MRLCPLPTPFKTALVTPRVSASSDLTLLSPCLLSDIIALPLLPAGYSFHNAGECLSLNEMEMVEDY